MGPAIQIYFPERSKTEGRGGGAKEVCFWNLHQYGVKCYGWQESWIINLFYLHLTFYSSSPFLSPRQRVEKERGEHFTSQKLQSVAKEARVRKGTGAVHRNSWGTNCHVDTDAAEAEPTQGSFSQGGYKVLEMGVIPGLY